jgi:hypothetical protein
MYYGSDLKEKLVDRDSQIYSDLKDYRLEDSEYIPKMKNKNSLVVSVCYN